jgi:YHS domain-containing protein
MTEHEEPEKVLCHVCQAVVPKATAVRASADGVVFYFCDDECLDLWEKPGKNESGS